MLSSWLVLYAVIAISLGGNLGAICSGDCKGAEPVISALLLLAMLALAFCVITNSGSMG